MNRNRMLLGLGVALAVAFLASSYVYRQLRRSEPSGNGKVGTEAQVVVAAGPLRLGQRLAAKDLTLQSWPEGKQPQGSFSRMEDCVGRATIAPLVSGEVVLDQELANREAGEGLPVSIPEGMRAVSVGVDEVIAVAGFVTPGTFVDVLVTGVGPGGPETRTILEHVRVLAVGQELQGDTQKPHAATVVTMLVTPEDGERLTLAAAEGKIHLALRNTVDMTDVKPLPVHSSTIFPGTVPTGAGARVTAAKPAPPRAPFTVQVIRGDKVETQSFPQ